MKKEKSGRMRPEEVEPRELGPYTAAPDQSEVSPQPVVFDDNATESVEQITGPVPMKEIESETGSGDLVEQSVMDTGSLEYRGWIVRTVVLGGGLDPHRRSWFVGKFLPR